MNRPIASALLTGDPGTPATNPKTGSPIWTAAPSAGGFDPLGAPVYRTIPDPRP